MLMPRYEVRGPDPDGDWFVVHGDDETAIDEVFDNEAEALAAIERMEARHSTPESR